MKTTRKRHTGEFKAKVALEAISTREHRRSGDHAAGSRLVCRHHPGLRRGRLYLPMRRGFLYLVAIMDWASRKVLAWRLSNTMDAEFCVATLKEALTRFGKPEIFNTDQGSQFSSNDFTNVLRDAKVKISMVGRGRWRDNVFIERLWRSLKYGCVYLNAVETGSELRTGLGRWIDYYNGRRPHSRFCGRTPDEVYGQTGTTPYPGHAPNMALTRMAA